MKYLEERVKVICENLYDLSIRDKIYINKWKYKEGFYLNYEDVINSSKEFEIFDINTMHWYGKDKHYWFSTSIEVPKELDNKSLWLHISTQIEDWDDSKNPQFLIFINDVPIQGGDLNHRDVLINNNVNQGEIYKIDVQAHSGILHSEFNFITYLYSKDNLIDKLYWDLLTPLRSLKNIDNDNLSKISLIKVLNDTINLLDFRTPYSNDFYNSIKKANDFIEEELYDKLSNYDQVIASCIGHTHIDVAWWWTVEQTKEKVCRSFATVLKLMDEYPFYKFMSSQPILYSFVKERYPSLYSQIKQRIKEGRWEVEGGMWVEADCNIPSGESFVRQFIYGIDFFQKEFNMENKILWLPDVFGYSAALPQIMKKVGIDYFMTTKLNWNQFNKFPHDTFMWRGLDGSEVLTHLVTTQEENQNPKSFFTTYNGKLEPSVLIASWKRYQDKNINNDILISYGYGDGGGGPTRDMLETSKRLEKGIAGIPKVRQVFSRKYFDDLNKKVSNNNRLGLWQGELYFEYHRGCYTSMARNKKSNRKIEFRLMNSELLNVFCNTFLNYPKTKLDELWLIVLKNQFHDILPGSSIEQVYEDTEKDYNYINDELNKLDNNCYQKLVSKEDGITLFNFTSFLRDEIVEIESTDANYLVDKLNNLYPIQSSKDCSVVEIKNIPPKGYKSFSYLKDTPLKIKNSFIIDDFSIENEYMRVEFNEFGNIVSIYDKAEKREIIESGKSANLFRLYEDKPFSYDNWNIDIYYSEKFWDLNSFVEAKWIERGPLRATLLLKREFSNSIIIQKIHFYYNSMQIDFDTYIDYRETQHLLKVFFCTNIHSDEATYDIQFGNLKRKTHTNTSWDEAKFEVCAHKWMDVSEGHYGFSVLNDCKYGCSVNNGEMALTLIKSGIEPNPNADKEEHYFKYSIVPHKNNWTDAKIVKKSYFFNQDIIKINKKTNLDEFSLASIDKENVIIDTIKQSEDKEAIIIRMYECENSHTNATLYFNHKINDVYVCDLLERCEKQLSHLDNNIKISIKPYEILTLKIY